MSKKTQIVAAGLVAIFLCAASRGQNARPTETPKPPLCKREDVFTLIEQQIDATKTLDDDARRVEVLIRAADILWRHKEDDARKAYRDAFALAKRHFKEKGERREQEGRLPIDKPDLRYAVISSVTRHDAKWSKKLAADLLSEQEEDAATSTKESQQTERTAERLLTLATSVLSSDEAAAVSFARSSLNYPATMYLSNFIYTFSARSKPGADQFYQEALAAYANAPMERLLYLSAYPFGNNRDAGDTPGHMIYQVPPNFTPNPSLQRLLVQTILQRVQRFISNPSAVSTGTRVSDPEAMWLALARLEKQIQQTLPDLAPGVESAKNNVAARLSPESQRELQRKASPNTQPAGSFDEQVEAALKNPNVDARDQRLTFAVINSSRNESVDKVIQVIDKVSDLNIRQPLLNWFFFERSQRALKEQKLEDAKRFAGKVEELDQRAFLNSQIAEEALRQDADPTRAREILEEVVDAAARAPNTTVKARALFAVATLYTKIDMNRAVAVVGEAIECVNRIEAPDFSRQFIVRKIEGKHFGMYASVATTGYKPETALAELAMVDFDNTLNQASRFTDKFLRSLTILAITERCLRSLPPAGSQKALALPQ